MFNKKIVEENIFKVKKYGVYFSLFFTICEFDLGRINDIHNFVECVKAKSFAINPIKGSTKTLNMDVNILEKILI